MDLVSRAAGVLLPRCNSPKVPSCDAQSFLRLVKCCAVTATAKPITQSDAAADRGTPSSSSGDGKARLRRDSTPWPDRRDYRLLDLNAGTSGHSTEVVSRLHVIFTVKWPSAAVLETTTPASEFSLIPNSTTCSSGAISRALPKLRELPAVPPEEHRPAAPRPEEPPVAPNAPRADAVVRDLNEHWAVPGFELNDLRHTNRL